MGYPESGVMLNLLVYQNNVPVLIDVKHNLLTTQLFAVFSVVVMLIYYTTNTILFVSFARNDAPLCNSRNMTGCSVTQKSHLLILLLRELEEETDLQFTLILSKAHTALL